MLSASREASGAPLGPGKNLAQHHQPSCEVPGGGVFREPMCMHLVTVVSLFCLVTCSSGGLGHPWACFPCPDGRDVCAKRILPIHTPEWVKQLLEAGWTVGLYACKVLAAHLPTAPGHSRLSQRGVLPGSVR